MQQETEECARIVKFLTKKKNDSVKADLNSIKKYFKFTFRKYIIQLNFFLIR